MELQIMTYDPDNRTGNGTRHDARRKPREEKRISVLLPPSPRVPPPSSSGNNDSCIFPRLFIRHGQMPCHEQNRHDVTSCVIGFTFLRLRPLLLLALSPFSRTSTSNCSFRNAGFVEFTWHYQYEGPRRPTRRTPWQAYFDTMAIS